MGSWSISILSVLASLLFGLYILNPLRKIQTRFEGLIVKYMGDDPCANKLACLLRPTALLFARLLFC
jgi:hypothetical protein